MKKEIIIIIFLIAAFFMACKKNFFSHDSTSLQNEKDWLKNNGGIFRGGTIDFTDSKNQLISGTLNWDDSYRTSTDSFSFLIVPFVFNNSVYPSKRIYYDISEKESPAIYALLIRDNIYTGARDVKMNARVFAATTTKSRKVYDFYYNKDGKNEFGFLSNQKGRTRIYLNTSESREYKTNSKGFTKANSTECTEGVVKTRFISCEAQSNTQVTCTFYTRSVFTYYCPTPDYSIEENIYAWLYDEFGSGGYTTTKEQTELANQDIIDSLQGYPCAQAVLAQMPNCNEQVSHILDSVFGINSETNIKFRVNPFLPDSTVAQTISESGALSNYIAVVEMNPKYLSGSQDYIASTMIHEALHAYITYQRVSLGTDTTTFKGLFPIYWEFRGNEAQHNEMAGNYINMMTSFLQNINTNLPTDVAQALAWGGLEKTAVYKAKTQTSKDSIQAYNYRMINPTTGTVDSLKIKKCS